MRLAVAPSSCHLEAQRSMSLLAEVQREQVEEKGF